MNSLSPTGKFQRERISFFTEMLSRPAFQVSVKSSSNPFALSRHLAVQAQINNRWSMPCSYLAPGFSLPQQLANFIREPSSRHLPLDQVNSKFDGFLEANRQEAMHEIGTRAIEMAKIHFRLGNGDVPLATTGNRNSIMNGSQIHFHVIAPRESYFPLGADKRLMHDEINLEPLADLYADALVISLGDGDGTKTQEKCETLCAQDGRRPVGVVSQDLVPDEDNEVLKRLQNTRGPNGERPLKDITTRETGDFLVPGYIREITLKAIQKLKDDPDRLARWIASGKKVVFESLGLTFHNLYPEERRQFLANITEFATQHIAEGGKVKVVLGVDETKNEKLLIDAYDDPSLSQFDAQSFIHQKANVLNIVGFDYSFVDWERDFDSLNNPESRIERNVIFTKTHLCRVGRGEFSYEEGEKMNQAIRYAFDRATLNDIYQEAGWEFAGSLPSRLDDPEIQMGWHILDLAA